MSQLECTFETFGDAVNQHSIDNTPKRLGREIKLLIEDCQRLVAQGLKSAAISCETPREVRSPDQGRQASSHAKEERKQALH